MQRASMATIEDRRVAELHEHIERIPDRAAEDDSGRRGDGDADEGVERHRERQAEGLADDLVPLGGGIAREIGDVERKGRPEADHAGQPGNEEAHETGPPLGWPASKAEGWDSIGPKPPAAPVGPAEEDEPERDEEGRLDAQEQADRVDAAVDDPHVDAPEDHEADELRRGDPKRVGRGRPAIGGEEHTQDLVDRLAADPGLDAEPAAGDQGAQEGGQVRAARPERGPAENGEGDAVARAGVRVQEDRHEDDRVAEEDGEDRPPTSSCRRRRARRRACRSERRPTSRSRGPRSCRPARCAAPAGPAPGPGS